MSFFLEWVESALWLLLLAGAPLAIVPQGYDSFLLPKVLWAESLIVLLACLRLIRVLLGTPFRLAFSPALGTLVAFGLWSALSAAWAASRPLAVGEARFWLLLALAGVLFQDAFWRRPGRLKALGIALAASAVLTALWALDDDTRAALWPSAARIQNKLGDWRGSIAAGFGNTSHIADFLTLAYPLLFIALLRARRWVTMAIALAALWVLYAALIVCFSVHSNVGLILAMLVTGGLLWRAQGWEWLQRRVGRLGVLAAGWIVIALFYSFDLTGNPHRPGIFHQAFASNRLEFGIDSRIFIWDTTLEMIRRHPWLGAGGGNFVYEFPLTHSPLVMADPDLRWMAGSWTNAAHNSLLQAWAELGVAGPALLVLLFVLTVRALLAGVPRGAGEESHGPIAALAALAAFAVHAQMNFPLQMTPASLILVMIVGLSVVWIPEGDARFRLPDLCLEYDWGRLVVELATFRRPRALRIEPVRAPRLALVAAVVVCLPLAFLQLRSAGRKEAADIVYRAADEARQRAFALAGDPATEGALPAEAALAFRAADERFQRALRLWPRHSDCRSAYSEMLVRQGRGREALEQIDLVLQRLRAWEIYLRRARALWLIGDREAARRDAQKAFDMKPAEALNWQRAAAWARGAIPATDDLTKDLDIPRPGK